MKMNKWVSTRLKKDEYVAITGTTSGIGLEYAKAFAEMGCNLVCLSNETEVLRNQKTEFETRYKIKVVTFDVDLSDVEATKKAAKAVGALPIGILVNNAGFGLKGAFEKNPVDSYIDIISVNVTAPVVFTHAVLPQMQKRGVGAIIHVASINALVPIPNNQVYTATKAFIFSYASAVARENKRTNLRFQLVLPGTTKTPFHDRQGAVPQRMTMMPEDVVKASFKNIEQAICIPNKADSILAHIVPFIPRTFAMDMASYLLKKRLGL